MKPLGKPVNNLVKSCEDVTANCVIWDGPNISADCLGVQIYQGDSIVPILYNTFKRFCELLQKIDLTSVDSSCIIDLSSQPDKLVDLINLINEKLCDDEIRIAKEENKATTTNIAGLPFCLQIKSDAITITKLPIEEQLLVVASKVCEELDQIETLQTQLDPTGDIYTQLDDLDDLITAQCSAVVPNVTQLCLSPNEQIELAAAVVPANQEIQFTTPGPHPFVVNDVVNVTGFSPAFYNVLSATVTGITFNTFTVSASVLAPAAPGIPSSFGAFAVISTSLSVEDAYEILEKAFCTFRNFTGTPVELQTAIARDCPNLGSLPALSNTGVMSDIYGWINNPINAAQSINNLWLTICDLRVAIKNLLQSCCADTPCLSFDIGYQLFFGPNDSFLEVVFNNTYANPYAPPPTLELSTIYSLDRFSSYNSGAVPGWLPRDFPYISTVRITLDDGSGPITIDTGQTIMQLMTLPAGTGYVISPYPAGYDPTAPVKTITIEFDYKYVLKITNVTVSAPGKLTYTTATKHPFVTGSVVNITNTTPGAYVFTGVTVTAVPSSTQFTINAATVPAPPAYVSGGNVIQSSMNCDTCECCCTFSITNGIY